MQIAIQDYIFFYFFGFLFPSVENNDGKFSVKSQNSISGCVQTLSHFPADEAQKKH